MEALRLAATDSTPEVTLDAMEGMIELKGRSIPENASSFYLPIIDWLTHYTEHPSSKTTFNFYLEYINSISQKMLVDIFHKAEELRSSGKNIEINWMFDEDDEEMLEEGEVFNSKFNLEMNLKPVSL